MHSPNPDEFAHVPARATYEVLLLLVDPARPSPQPPSSKAITVHIFFFKIKVDFRVFALSTYSIPK